MVGMSGSPRQAGDWHEVAWTDCSGSVGRTTDGGVRVVAVNSREPAGDWGRRTVPVERRTRLGDPASPR